MGVNYTGTNTTPKEALGEALQEYIVDQNSFIGPKVFKPLVVQNQSGVITVHSREALLKLHDNKRSPGMAYNAIDSQHKEINYACVDRGNKCYVDDSERARYASFFDADFDAVQDLVSQILRQHESRVATEVFNTTTFTGSSLYLDTSTVWASATLAQISADVNAAKQAVLDKTGMAANALVMSYNTMNLIANLLVNLTAYTQAPSIADQYIKDRISAYFGLECLVGSEKYDSTSEGLTTGAMTAIWSDSYVSVCRVASEGAGMKESCLGRTTLFAADMGSDMFALESYRDNDRRSDVWVVRHTVDEFLIDAKYGFLLKID
jgi:hypothetical protein